MSEHKNKSVVAVKSSGIVIGDGKHHRPYRLYFRLVGVVLAGTIIVVALAYVVLAVVHHYNKDTAKTAPSSATKLVPLTPTEEAAYLTSQGKYADAQKIYDAQLKAATDKKSQAAAYSAKATTALSAKDYAAARTYETKADGLDPTAGRAEFLGDIAAAQGDKKAAAGYYQSALNRLDTSAPTYGYVANKIQAKLNGVKQ